MNAGANGARYTPQQKSAILRDDHTLIEAGAGSGKTTTLVNKILHALGAEVVSGVMVREPCELSQIAAITFTTAAAADLKRKLRTGVRRIADATGDPVWRARIYEVDRARIGTIHGFCSGLLREFGIRVGLDPAFAVLDEGEASALRETCAHDVLFAALRGSDERAVSLVSRAGTSGAISFICSAISAGDGATGARESWCDARGRTRMDDLARQIRTLRTEWECPDDRGEWHAEADPIAAELAATILHLARDARNAMLQRMAQAPALDFDALITTTRDVLAAHPAVLASVRRRLTWLFIDEFQDTDPAQLDIAYRICGFGRCGGAVADTNNRGANLSRSPRLCIVGDPKQSIYRFRRADVSLWGRVVADFAAAGISAIGLATNFRSRAPIVGFVNATFEGLIGVGGPAVLASGHEIPYSALLSHREAPHDDGLVELLSVASDGDANQRRAREAQLIAARIAELTQDDRAVYVDDCVEPHFRSAQYRDVALLFHARKPMSLYKDALTRAGIPCYVTGGDGFFECREVRDVRLLLACLINPHDDVAWFGLLRSPFVGLRDESVLRFRLQNAGCALSVAFAEGAIGNDGADTERIIFARRWLASLRLLCDRVSVAQLIRHALESSGYTAQMLFGEDGDAALANVLKLARIADAAPEMGLVEFASFLQQRSDADGREAEAPLFTADENVVTLTTVHGAKGLEWPVVVLCDLERDIENKSPRSQLIFDARAGIALNVSADVASTGETAAAGAWEVLDIRERALSRAEEKRLWYVASTRARDRLVLCVADPTITSAEMNDSGKSATRSSAKRNQDMPSDVQAAQPTCVRQWLTRALTSGDGYFVYEHGTRRWTAGSCIPLLPATPAAVARDGPPCMNDLSGAPELPRSVRQRVDSIIAPIVLSRRSATELMKLSTDPTAHRKAYVLGMPDRGSAPPARATDGGSNARDGSSVPAHVLGDVLHLSLEQLRDNDDLDLFHERELVSRLGDAADSSRVRSAVCRLRELVTAAQTHPTIRAMYESSHAERELPFTWLHQSAAGEMSLLHGAMDLVSVSECGRAEILDFKSHRLRAGEEVAAADGYSLQRDIYAAAFAAISGRSPAGFTFFFPQTSTPVRHDLVRESVANGLARIDALISGGPAT